MTATLPDTLVELPPRPELTARAVGHLRAVLVQVVPARPLRAAEVSIKDTCGGPRSPTCAPTCSTPRVSGGDGEGNWAVDGALGGAHVDEAAGGPCWDGGVDLGGYCCEDRTGCAVEGDGVVGRCHGIEVGSDDSNRGTDRAASRGDAADRGRCHWGYISARPRADIDMVKVMGPVNSGDGSPSIPRVIDLEVFKAVPADVGVRVVATEGAIDPDANNAIPGGGGGAALEVEFHLGPDPARDLRHTAVDIGVEPARAVNRIVGTEDRADMSVIDNALLVPLQFLAATIGKSIPDQEAVVATSTWAADKDELVGIDRESHKLRVGLPVHTQEDLALGGDEVLHPLPIPEGGPCGTIGLEDPRA